VGSTFQATLTTIGFQSSVLVGLLLNCISGSSCFRFQPTSETGFHEYIFAVIYTVCSTLACCSLLMVIAVSSYVLCEGPSEFLVHSIVGRVLTAKPPLSPCVSALALTGPVGSLSKVVRGMYIERRNLLRLYRFGVIALSVSIIPEASMNREIIGSSTALSVIVPSILFLALYIRLRTQPRFSFPPGWNKDQSIILEGTNAEEGVRVVSQSPDTSDKKPPLSRAFSTKATKESGKPSPPTLELGVEGTLLVNGTRRFCSVKSGVLRVWTESRSEHREFRLESQGLKCVRSLPPSRLHLHVTLLTVAPAVSLDLEADTAAHLRDWAFVLMFYDVTQPPRLPGLRLAGVERGQLGGAVTVAMDGDLVLLQDASADRCVRGSCSMGPCLALSYVRQGRIPI
jgi:hypothetical protein